MTLYKYVGAARVTILTDKLVCFSRPSQLNDPFEWQPWVPGVLSLENTTRQIEAHRANPNTPEEAAFFAEQERMVLHEGLSMESFNGNIAASMMDFINTELLPDYFEERFREHDELLGVFCLSENRESFLMWSHYGDSHRGFMIGFDSGHEFFNGNPPLGVTFPEIGSLHPVEYSISRPAMYASELTFKDEFLTKSQDWSYEREYRIIRLLNEHTGTNGNFHLFAIPTACVTEVILGANMGDSEIAAVRAALSSVDWQHVIVYQARLDKQQFKLHYDPL